jgi:hypothetical protein
VVALVALGGGENDRAKSEERVESRTVKHGKEDVVFGHAVACGEPLLTEPLDNPRGGSLP